MAKGDKKNIILERRKSKTPQKENPGIPDGRDMFQTPNYAIELLIPFLFKSPRWSEIKWIWEPACGEGKIANLLPCAVFRSDIREGLDIDSEYDFLDRSRLPFMEFQLNKFMIITNPPFSLKKKFYERCRELDMPFALLIPADYSGWIIKATQDGCEKIIPTRRIDYITPTGLSGASGHTSYYHSMWLTYGLGLGRTETFVELTNEMKKNI